MPHDNDKKKNHEKGKREPKDKTDEYLAGWQRERADFQNYKKDAEKRMATIASYAKADCLADFLRIADYFVSALEHAPEEVLSSSWGQGIGHIQREIDRFLENQGVERMQTVGQKFDPALHEAVEEVEGEKPGRISKEVQAGYTMGDRVLRAAKVKVVK